MFNTKLSPGEMHSSSVDQRCVASSKSGWLADDNLNYRQAISQQEVCTWTYFSADQKLLISAHFLSRLSHAARRDSSSHVRPWQKYVGKDRKGNAF